VPAFTGVNEQDEDVSLAVELAATLRYASASCSKQRSLTLAAVVGQWRLLIVDPDNGHAHPSYLLDQIGFEKVECRGLAPVDHWGRLASLRDWIAALRFDLHLVAKARREAKSAEKCWPRSAGTAHRRARP